MRRGVVCAAAVLALAGACGDPEADPRALNALQAAAAAVDDVSSSRMELQMKIGIAGQEVTIDADGLFDFDRMVGKSTMTFDSALDAPTLGGTSRIIVEGAHVYVKGPAAEWYGGTGDGWVRVDLSDVPGMSSSQINQNPAQYVEFLRGAAGDVREVGSEDVRGTPTTHYSAEVTMEDVVAATDDENTRAFVDQLEASGGEIGEIPIDVWIGSDGLPYRLVLEMTISGVEGLPGGGDMTMRMDGDLFDYGVPVHVRVPKRFEEGAFPQG